MGPGEIVAPGADGEAASRADTNPDPKGAFSRPGKEGCSGIRIVGVQGTKSSAIRGQINRRSADIQNRR
jgi:hypothetical protein